MIKIKAAQRLQGAEISTQPELMNLKGLRISTGGNTFRFPTPEEAYEKAAAFIKQIQRDGYKYTKRGTMSDKMDVFKKGTSELSISVHEGLLNIDLW